MDPNQVGSMSNQNKNNKAKQAREAVSNVAHQAKDEIAKGARHAKEQVSHKAEDQAEMQKNRALSRVDSVTNAFDRLAEELRENDETWLSEQAVSIASGVRRASDTLRRKHPNEIIEDVRGFSRHPVAFLGGAFAIGLAAGRFLKSSPRNSHDDYLEPSYDVTDDYTAGQRWGAPNDVYATPSSPAVPPTAPPRRNSSNGAGGLPSATTSRTVSVGNGRSSSGRDQ